MEKFSQAEFDAFGEAGLTREEALNTVHDFYAKQAEKKYQEGVARGFLNLKVLLIAAATIVVGTGGFFGIKASVEADRVAFARHLDACGAGNAVVCLEGVQDEFRGANEAIANAKGNKSAGAFHFDRANQLLLAYRQKTGQVLPSK